MKIFEELNEENFYLFAAHYYNNPQCSSVDEFFEDLARFKYLKKLTNRILKNEILDDDISRIFRLMTNHVITLFNVFDIEPAKKMFFYKMTLDQMTIIKPIMIYLSLIRETDFVDIPLNKIAVEQFRKI